MMVNLVIPGLNLQEFSDVHFGPTNNMLFNTLYTTQYSKKCNNFENVASACSKVL
jgi:hypothetical protein